MNNSNITKIQVVAPSGLRSGGPESLHNLVFQINALGIKSELVYFPYKQQYDVTFGYENYIPCAFDINDEASTLIIFPETLCMLGFALKNATVAIWWLSVDHFTQRQYYSFRDNLRYLRFAIRRHRPFLGVRSLHKFIHFSKSTYDENYLNKNGLSFLRLTGPISADYYSHKPTANIRRSVILYNPKKGYEVTAFLKNNFSQFKFISLDNQSTQELIDIYSTSKLYIDFGNHPGKERMPREAVVLGCCLLTGVFGSASNDLDIPIPRKYKLDPSTPDFFYKFQLSIGAIFNNFEIASLDFQDFKNEIISEQQQQINDLKIIINQLNHPIRRANF